MTEPQYTYGDLTYESVTIVARGGSVPGPRHLILTLEAGDAQAPEWLDFLAWFRLRQRQQQAAAQDDAPSFGPIG